jgi:hypothetical protein
MKKLSLGLMMAVLLIATPAFASIHGGGNPRPPGSLVVGAGSALLR